MKRRISDIVIIFFIVFMLTGLLFGEVPSNTSIDSKISQLESNIQNSELVVDGTISDPNIVANDPNIISKAGGSIGEVIIDGVNGLIDFFSSAFKKMFS